MHVKKEIINIYKDPWTVVDDLVPIKRMRITRREKQGLLQ